MLLHTCPYPWPEVTILSSIKGGLNIHAGWVLKKLLIGITISHTEVVYSSFRLSAFEIFTIVNEDRSHLTGDKIYFLKKNFICLGSHFWRALKPSPLEMQNETYPRQHCWHVRLILYFLQPWPCCHHNSEGVEILVMGKLHSLLFWIPEVIQSSILSGVWELRTWTRTSCTGTLHYLRCPKVGIQPGIQVPLHKTPSPQPDLPALQDAPNNPHWAELWTLNPLPPAAAPHLLLFKWNNRHKELKCWCNSWASFFKRNCTPHHLVIAICWTST